MNTLSAYLAWRFLWFKGKDKNISFMIKICFLSIFIGTFALMLTLIIMNGYEKVVHEKMQGIKAHVIISCPGHRLDYKDLRRALKKQFGNIIAQISGNSEAEVLLDTDDIGSILFLKGIDTDHEEEVSTLATKIIRPIHANKIKKPILKNLLHENQILIGHKLANQLHLGIGDTLPILIPEAGGRKKIFLNKKAAEIAGIFRIGLDEYDSNLAFTSLPFLNELFDLQGVENITIRLKPYRPSTLFGRIKNLFFPLDYEKEAIVLLRQVFPHLTICSWKDLYPDLVASLTIEKYASFIIMMLITLVAALNMISLLFMQIQHKLRDIAILKTIGLTNKPIRSIFLTLGMTITLLASLTGLGAAAAVGYMLENHPFIEVPDVYFVSHLPARMDLEIFIVVFVATLLLGFIATWIPAQRTKRIAIAKVLREE